MENLSGLDTFGNLLRAFRKRRGLTQQQVASRIGMHRNAIGRWEQGDFLPESKGIVLELATFLQLNALEARQFLEASFTALAPYWGVPYPRNPFFTGRIEYLEHLHRCLNELQTDHPTSYALHGLGGIGKTQLALEYAYRYVLTYTAVLWVHAENLETIITSFLSIAGLLQLRECQQADQQLIIMAVQRWLTTHSGWLLIWDNLEDIELLQRYLPPIRQGAVLITTRCHALGTLALGIELTTMTQEEGILFLLRRARLLAASSDETLLLSFCQHAPQEYTAAQEIVTLLGGLPLALDQVGAYLEETACRLQDYLQLYQVRQGELLARRGKIATNHPLSVATTLSLSLRRVEQANAAAIDLLRLCAFLHPDTIPEEIILKGAPALGEHLRSAAENLLQWHEVISALLTYSLIHRQAQEQILSLHRLVQEVMKEAMDAATREQWCTRAIQAVNAAFPTMEFANWQECERYLPQAQVCLLHSLQSGIHTSEAGRLFRETGCYLLERGRYEEAGHFLRQALTIREYQQEHDPFALAESLQGLATLLWRQGKYEAAQDLFQQAQTLFESHLDSCHAAIASNLNDLALLYYDQGKYDLAETVYQRIRTSYPWESLYPNVLDNMARLAQKQGQYEQAKLWYQRALENWERQPGPPHPDMTFSLNNLATLYMEQGLYEQAEPLLQRSLSLRQQTLGPQHPRTATGLHNLAKLFLRQGKYEQAVSLTQRALHIFEQQVGATHPSTANCLMTLATLARQQGQYEQAEALYQRVLKIRQEHLGPWHPDVAETLHDLASFSHQQHQMTEALSHYQRALAIRERVHGGSHPKTEKTRSALEQLLLKIKQEQEAVTMEIATPAPERFSLCACGCGQLIDTARSRGKPRRFFSQACRQRIYRHTLEQKRHTNNVTLMQNSDC
jgi:tetratricopeptide (TPR) repeat protein